MVTYSSSLAIALRRASLIVVHRRSQAVGCLGLPQAPRHASKSLNLRQALALQSGTVSALLSLDQSRVWLEKLHYTVRQYLDTI